MNIISSPNASIDFPRDYTTFINIKVNSSEERSLRGRRKLFLISPHLEIKYFNFVSHLVGTTRFLFPRTKIKKLL